MTVQVNETAQKLKNHKMRREEILAAKSLISENMEELKEKLQQQYLLENTARLNVSRARQQKEESEDIWQGLQSESRELDRQIQEMQEELETALKELKLANQREKEIEQENQAYQEKLDEQLYLESSVGKAVSEVQMEEANIRQKHEFAVANMQRVTAEIEKCDIQVQELSVEAAAAKENVWQKKEEIETIKKTILASDETAVSLKSELEKKTAQKEQMQTKQKGFFAKREEISSHMADLDKEIFRLNSQKEKIEETKEQQTNYMWEEYELTPFAAKSLREESLNHPAELKKQITALKEEIKSLGDVNVNAIEEYKEVLGRYEFLKTQHDDLIEAEAALVGIIEELDEGMRKQFTEKFAQIQREFDRAFKELFGGGKGTLELVEDEDILECGIRIVAQPPGKKLQNMILLSGGEKSLTAISLLFAIQNLKPSPFCLLDEIEAALDDSNVSRFAKYLHKLTKNTQFIVITHRRGTMASADRLYGITMQEKGVSTLVSVNLIENDLDK